MIEKLTPVKNRENGDILYWIKNDPSRFVEGEEYISVRRNPEDKLSHYIKRKSLLFHWK